MTTVDEATREQALAVDAIGGDKEAFRAIYDLLSLRVFNLVLRSVHERATAEDICQEVWLKAHREIHTLHSPEALRTWLFRMASRACIDYSRSRACRERGGTQITDEMLDAPFDEPEKVNERRGELRLMWEALAALPPRQSVALYLKQVEGCSYDEIGRVLNCPRTAVETLLFRARQGFARTHQRLVTEPDSSCKLISQTMAVVVDQEASQFQERAVEAHVNECRPCRVQMQTMGRSAAGYAWLPMLPVGQQALFSALAAGSGGLGAGIGIGRIVGALLLKAKAASTVAVVVGTVGTGVVAAGAATGVTPTPGDVVAMVQESVGSEPSMALEDERDQPSGAQGGDGSSGGTSTRGSGGSGAGSPGDTPVGLPPGSLPTSALPPADGIDPAVWPLDGGGTPGEDLDDALDDTVNTVVQGLGDTLDTALGGVTGVVTGVVDDVVDTLNDVLTDPVGTITDVLTDPAGTVADVVDTVDDAVEGTTGTTDDTVDDTTDVVDDLTGGATEDLTGAVDDVTDEVTDVVDDILGPPDPPEEPAVEEEGGGCVLIILC